MKNRAVVTISAASVLTIALSVGAGAAFASNSEDAAQSAILEVARSLELNDIPYGSVSPSIDSSSIEVAVVNASDSAQALALAEASAPEFDITVTVSDESVGSYDGPNYFVPPPTSGLFDN